MQNAIKEKLTAEDVLEMIRYHLDAFVECDEEDIKNANTEEFKIFLKGKIVAYKDVLYLLGIENLSTKIP